MRHIIYLFFLSFCTYAKAQIGVKTILKAGARTYGFNKFLPSESPGVSKQTWYTYNAAIQIPKFHISIEGTYREWGRYAFLKVPDFLIQKSKAVPPFSSPALPKIGDTLGTYIQFNPHWFSLSFNVLPNKWKKHQLLLGGGMINRNGGLTRVKYVSLNYLERKIEPDISQKTILWKSEYLFMPFKYTLLSARYNYAYFSKFPHGYYEFILSIGTYIDL